MLSMLVSPLLSVQYCTYVEIELSIKKEHGLFVIIKLPFLYNEGGFGNSSDS